MKNELLQKERQLKSELESIKELREKQAAIDLRNKNYANWVDRKPLWLLGKAYCAPNRADYGNTVLQQFGIFVTIPGNCSYTYDISSQVPQAVVTYFHNVWNEGMRQRFQSGINELAKSIVEEFLGNPKCVLDILGLQSDDYYLKREQLYPADLIAHMEKEIDEERFKVIDRFKESELLGISDDLSHSRSILYQYALSRGLQNLIKEFETKYHWARS